MIEIRTRLVTINYAANFLRRQIYKMNFIAAGRRNCLAAEFF